MSIFGAQTANAPRFDDEARSYDALLVLSFGGPEGQDDVIPFLENVTRGRNVPRERLEEVAEHYRHFGGVSPINAQNRALIAALEGELAEHGIALPIYFGNRNWHPFVTDTVRRMRDDGVREALVFVTSAFSSYSGCRQYREDVIRALETGRARRDPLRQDPRLLQPSGLRRADGGAGARGPGRIPGGAPGRRRGRLHRPLHPAGDGPRLRLRNPAPRGLPPGRRGRRDAEPPPGLPEPERFAARPLAGAGHPRRAGRAARRPAGTT